MIRDISYVGEGLIPTPLDGPALRYRLLAKSAVTDIAIHHMTGWNPPSDATSEQEIRFLVGIDEYHRHRGLDGIGYHVVPMASGRVYIVSRLDRYGAGVGGENDHLIHVALPGDYTSEIPAPGHLRAATGGVGHVYGYLGREVPTTPHLYWGNTSCPGARWREWVPQLKEDKMTPEELARLEALEAGLESLNRAIIADYALKRDIAAMVTALNSLNAAVIAHTDDDARHGGGGGLKRGDAVTLT